MNGECAPVGRSGPFQILEDPPCLVHVGKHILLGEPDNRIVVGSVADGLQLHECRPKLTQRIRRGRRNPPLVTPLPQIAVVERSVDTRPAFAGGLGNSDERVCGTSGKPVKQRVVHGTDRPSEVDLAGSAGATFGNQMIGGIQQVNRIHESLTSRRLVDWAGRNCRLTILSHGRHEPISAPTDTFSHPSVMEPAGSPPLPLPSPIHPAYIGAGCGRGGMRLPRFRPVARAEGVIGWPPT